MERSKTKTILRANITNIFHDKTANRPVKSKDKTVEIIRILFMKTLNFPVKYLMRHESSITIYQSSFEYKLLKICHNTG